MIKIQPIQMIEVQHWDDLVRETYKKPYSFQQQDGCQARGIVELKVPDMPSDFKNDTLPDTINGQKMGVSFQAWLARDSKEWNGPAEDRLYFDMFWQRNFYPDIQMLANDLHAKGLLPAGEYMINIDW